MTKLKAVLRSSTQEKANFLASRLKVYGNAQPKSRYMATLQNALTSFQRVRIDYWAASEDLTCRTLEPFRLTDEHLRKLVGSGLVWAA